MSCPTNCNCNTCSTWVTTNPPCHPCQTYVPTCNTCNTCATYSLPIPEDNTGCPIPVWECDGCGVLALKQLNNPCYNDIGPCTDGCEESIKTNCVLVRGNQLGGLQIESGVNMEVALRMADYRFQELAKTINTLFPGSVVSYAYKSSCPLVTISSIKKNGVETLSLPITTNRSGILGILQGADPLWLMTPTHFLIKGMDVWEIALTCN